MQNHRFGAVAEVLEAKRNDGRSPVYLNDLRNRLAIFCRDFGNQPVAAISTRDLAKPKTRANFRANISVLFGYAADEGMIDAKPVLRVKKPKLVDKSPEIFSVNEISALLHSAGTVAPNVVPMLALGAFAGLRESEIKRLDWAEIEELAECSWSEALSKSVVTSSELANLGTTAKKAPPCGLDRGRRD